MGDNTSRELIQLLKDMEQRSQRVADGLPDVEAGQPYWEGILFSIAGVPMVAPLQDVKEILNFPSTLTMVPGAKKWVLGIANIRGTLLTIVDLQVFLGAEPVGSGKRSRILVIHLHGVPMGLLVAGVEGLRRATEDQRLPAPGLSAALQPFVQDAFEFDGETRPIFQISRLADNPAFQVAAA